ncbi:MAG: hypothetical protein ACF8NJ_03000 [Phycisphaerales bacterium JB038]
MRGHWNPQRFVGVLIAACLASAVGPLGCTAPRVDRQAYVAVPPDFSLDVLAIGADRVADWGDLPPAEQHSLPRPLLSARFIVDADGTLRAATGPGCREETYPAMVRTLSRPQMLELWRTVRNQALIDAESTHRLSKPDEAQPLAGSALYAIGIVALGDRVSIGVPAEEASRVGEGGRRLITLLRTYAWLEN